MTRCRENPAAVLCSRSESIPNPLRAIPRRPYLRRKLTHEIETAAVGQAEVAHHEIDRGDSHFFFGHPERRVEAVGRQNVVSHAAQEPSKNRRCVGVIFDQQNPLRTLRHTGRWHHAGRGCASCAREITLLFVAAIEGKRELESAAAPGSGARRAQFAAM